MKRSIHFSLTIFTAVAAMTSSVFAGITDISLDAKAELAARRANAKAQVSSQQQMPTAATEKVEPAQPMDLNPVLQAIADDNHDQNIVKVVIVYKDGTQKTFSSKGVETKVSGASQTNSKFSEACKAYDERPIGPDNNPGAVNKYRRGGALGY